MHEMGCASPPACPVKAVRAAPVNANCAALTARAVKRRPRAHGCRPALIRLPLSLAIPPSSVIASTMASENFSCLRVLTSLPEVLEYTDTRWHVVTLCN